LRMLSTMLSTLLSIAGPSGVTSWTCAKRLKAYFVDVFVSMRFYVTVCNILKTRAGRLDTVGVAGSIPVVPTKIPAG